MIVEALNRLARKLSDVANLHDELQFHGMSLHAVNVGAVATMYGGMLGTMAQMCPAKHFSPSEPRGRLIAGRSKIGRRS